MVSWQFALQLLAALAAAHLGVANVAPAACGGDSTCEASAMVARSGAGLLQTNAESSTGSQPMLRAVEDSRQMPSSLLSSAAGATAKAKVAPLIGKVTVLEKDVKTLQAMVQDLEDNVGADDVEEDSLSAIDIDTDGSQLEEPSAPKALPTDLPAARLPASDGKLADVLPYDGSPADGSLSDGSLADGSFTDSSHADGQPSSAATVGLLADDTAAASLPTDGQRGAAAPADSIADVRRTPPQRSAAAVARPRRKAAAALVEVDVENRAVPKSSLHQRVKTLESNIADLQSRTGTLENDVYGESENVGASLVGTLSASLLATEQHRQAPGMLDAHLKGRVVKVEKAIFSLKGRITGLQHEVLG